MLSLIAPPTPSLKDEIHRAHIFQLVVVRNYPHRTRVRNVGGDQSS
jgi:hypothetical protein